MAESRSRARGTGSQYGVDLKGVMVISSSSFDFFGQVLRACAWLGSATYPSGSLSDLDPFDGSRAKAGMSLGKNTSFGQV